MFKNRVGRDEEALSSTDEDSEPMSWKDVCQKNSNSIHREKLESTLKKRIQQFFDSEQEKFQLFVESEQEYLYKQLLQSEEGHSDVTIVSAKAHKDEKTTMNTDEDEEDDDRRYPRDAYTIIALNGPSGNCWPVKKVLFFLFGLTPFLFQLSFLGLLLCKFDEPVVARLADSDHNRMTALVTSLLAYLVFPNSTFQDLIKAIAVFPSFGGAQEEDYTSIACMRISCLLRGIQGSCAIMTVFVLVMSSENAYDIILNFTAVNFISELDEVAFSLAKSGTFGLSLKQEAKRIANTRLPDYSYRQNQHVCYGIALAYSTAIMFGLMTIVMITQERGVKWIRVTMWSQFVVGFGLIFLCITCASMRCCSARCFTHAKERRSTDLSTVL